MKRKNSKIGFFEAVSVFALVVFLAVAPDVADVYPTFVFWHGVMTGVLIGAVFVPWRKIKDEVKANIRKAEIRRAYYLQATMRERVESNMYNPKKTRK